ncbi:adenosylcobalamin-dependent ribonucleoside-diphosphate reductase [Pectinatus haikarae]|uniref:Vitamin B12-dependent ribonucleotide reductase n=1 Tax=Pectinatus haikarae TaxID=349096 RepID=A0ABT9Y5V3_9FIRM|nr:adenosylcobalamin-dependent ribonucleoside-diphosphate reductase [Pectinatus haikarae]MDQ0203197.1 ribonucleoside-diphosphate reductase alpha chain [Pectinatus haikarae]
MEKWYESDIGKNILKSKYYHVGEKDPQIFIDRVTSIFSAPVQKAMRQYLEAGSVCPAGRTLYATGAKGKFKASLSNCYILPSPEDNIESIFKINTEIARIFSYGGGIGVNISRLRPKESLVNNAARTSTGSVSFLKIFDSTGEVISQNGRRGAMMVGLNCDHPDIYEFLHMKQNNEKLASMNISILFKDDFMKAVLNNDEYELKFDVEATGEKIRKKINAASFFKEYCRTQWDWGDPGALFVDKLNNYTLLSGYSDYNIEITNPCGEFGGNAYNSCNLMSINLYNFIDDKFGEMPHLNEKPFRSAIDTAVRALDEILDYGYETQPLEANRKCIDDWRSIGLGLFGVADALIAMKLKYGSRQGNQFITDVIRIMFIESARASSQIAKEKNTFGRYEWEKTKASPLMELLYKEAPDVYDNIKENGLRNGTLLSIAPTGTISLLMGTFSGGCEPLYKISYMRTTHKMEGEKKSFKVYAHAIKELLEYHKLPYDIDDAEIKKRFPWIIESHHIPYLDRVKLQAAMQKYVDNSISSTVNLRHDATPEEIKDIYIAAWKSGCKGITVFRDGCRRGNILGVSEPKTKIEYDTIQPIKRDDIARLDGCTLVRHTSCVDKLYITINKTSDGQVFEVFTNASGGCSSNIATITRLTSLALRSGISVKHIIKQLAVSKCSACQALIRGGRRDISLSCGNAIASALAEIYNETQQKKPAEKYTNSAEDAAINKKCPECSHYTLKPEGNCVTCTYCGWSKCE